MRGQPLCRSRAHSPIWTRVMKDIFLVLFGFVLGWLPAWANRRRRLKTHWSAIRAELDLCSERASALLHDAVQSPLYRLPSSAYLASFPALLTEGALTESEYSTMGRFFCQVGRHQPGAGQRRGHACIQRCGRSQPGVSTKPAESRAPCPATRR